ncbi:Molybdenum cofactor biosynthesis protein 1 [Cercospora beticola]|uniref:Molybdenum cofactor biosynthesis protein 1 n=1 Tax=Cercospora beticola TaxID=122368 RepID=A0A2G5I4M6_CERBT|nr:Molybdenum cofactor biosynthesis protein 1 [Cercospora beticola]PIA99443.1 Molybdenum cofactor biosynthesis protein 1 [Cercospora beticola]WPB00455.1 hypothetical protein RHO25_005074 [Cercospora beticola]CAK1361330.1 unnamed protein product [Cercospora beticola]
MATTTWPRALPRAVQRAQWTRLNRRPIATAAVSRELPTVDQRIPPLAPSLPSQPARKEKLRDAKPFSEFLTDNFDRQHDYLRISLTERCNLRCTYCMPSEGIQLSPDREILTTPEIYYLSALFVNQGVNKIRLTGGEPTVRKDIVPLMQQIGSLRRNGLKELALTTNGISLHRKLDDMVEAGLTGVNISLDTLDPLQFPLLTRRNGFNAVMKSIDRVQEMNKLGAGIKLKINCVAMRGINDDQILKFVEMTREQDLEVRFIEYMPFGGNRWAQKKMLPYAEMVDLIKVQYPTLSRLQDAKNDTSKTWQVPGFKGRVGFITSMTHNFCGTCNRLRITSDGNLKVCLHGNAEVSLRDLLRADNSGNPMDEQAFEAIRQIELDRRNTERGKLLLDGEEGWMTKERQLLEVIGAAVKRKAAKHADMGDLENMQNRPMILIGKPGISTSFGNSSQHIPIRQRRTSPWSRVPLHIIQPASFGSQARTYSSKSDSDAGNSTSTEENKSEPATRLATAFRFQSLSGLFEQPKRGRYSSPQERQTEGSTESQTPDNREEPEIRGDAVTGTTEKAQESSTSPVDEVSADNEGVGITATSTSTISGTQREHTVAEIGDAFRRRFIAARRLPSGSAIRSTQRRQRGPRKPNNSTANFAASAGGLRRTNPFSTPPNPSITRSHEASELKDPGTLPSRAQNPWGLYTENKSLTSADREPATDVIEPSVTKDSDRRAVAKDNTAVEKASNNEPSQASTAASRSKKSKTGSNKNLTHLTSTGEAHMVDVGGKQSTKRIAIATSRVRFSNDEPLRLIAENNNKKGDVLSVARIAGIMAAKRTSDIIPLCHPIGITKVEVELLPERSRKLVKGRLGRRLPGTPYGSVIIQARVDCYGTTGVEMEALTAAAAAALTVYDMCKAVDKEMQILGTIVVYKSGGKSGLYVNDIWAKAMGAEWFIERGLEIPVAIKTMLNTPKTEGEREEQQDELGDGGNRKSAKEGEGHESEPPLHISDRGSMPRIKKFLSIKR